MYGLGVAQAFLPTTFKIGPKRHISKLKTRNDKKNKKKKTEDSNNRYAPKRIRFHRYCYGASKFQRIGTKAKK